MNGAISLLSLEEFRRLPDLVMELSFPAKDRDYSSTILEELEEIGIDGIYAKPAIDGLKIIFIGKGYRGIVVKGRLRGFDAAIKILRTDTAVGGLDKEAEATEMANQIGIGPKLLGYSRHVLILEYIEGKHFGKWVEELAIEKTDVLKDVLSKSLLQARSLDRLGLDHGELSDARKHIIVKPSLDPIIIDFGKARIKNRPSNVTSLFSYIAFGPQSKKILQMLRVSDPPIYASRRYKRDFDEESFSALMEALNL